MKITDVSRCFAPLARVAVLAAAMGAITMLGLATAEMTTTSSTTPATAATGEHVAAPTGTAAKRTYFCVQNNNTRYWRQPNVDPLGQVHRGQGLDNLGGKYIEGVYWYNVNLWGGMRNVWILQRNVSVCE
ncbi:hypothetical protein [Streptomyces tsukubensis]|uniref:SH3 domain-containing protein n=1 Tax=Streptomyces tsukubensis TaxID=83656 RepID=A0A1V4A2H1_9ACTN|nr:hypothetical protein [Streptomyces tsukubensis]OON73443.1 hypothetical protein B1H18_27035 [Streptomyces tsukubensis]QFR96765.1 hypothetical protein GBW32_31660 [Streptomyces tsukubensis]